MFCFQVIVPRTEHINVLQCGLKFPHLHERVGPFYLLSSQRWDFNSLYLALWPCVMVRGLAFLVCLNPPVFPPPRFHFCSEVRDLRDEGVSLLSWAAKSRIIIPTRDVRSGVQTKTPAQLPVSVLSYFPWKTSWDEGSMLFVRPLCSFLSSQTGCLHSLSPIS